LSETGGNRLLVAARGQLAVARQRSPQSGANAAELERVGIRSDWLRSWRFAEQAAAVAR
jgi:hypothetical protein